MQYNRDADLANLLLDEYLDVTAKYQQSVRDIVALAVQAGVPVPTFSAAITYFDSYRSSGSSSELDPNTWLLWCSHIST